MSEFARIGISGQSTGVGTRVAAGAALDEVIQRGNDIARKLDAIVRNKYANNAAIVAEWTSASHTERAPRRVKPEQPPGSIIYVAGFLGFRFAPLQALCTRSAGLIISCDGSWGFASLHPRLYAVTRFAGSSMHEWDVIVIGAGAAGLFCAVQAGQRGRKVLVIEHADRVGKKIAISGGGRCNFTNTGTSPDNFVSRNPHFCKSALARYPPADFIALVEKHGIAYHEKKLGQLFCDGSSQQIIDMLLRECHDASVEIRCDCEVLQVDRHEPSAERSFIVQTNQGTFHSASVVIATGGLSIAPLGATDFGYRIARQFGLRIEETRAGLVPFTLPAEIQKQLVALSGISIDALVTCPESPSFRENILITHRGLSGPAILQVSNYWRPGESISINLLPDEDVMEIISAARIIEGDLTASSATKTVGQSSRIELGNLLSRYLPRRFAQAWCDLYGASRPLKQYNAKELQEIADNIHRLQLTPAGTEGFRKAEVTVGGVSTTDLSSQTMEARRVSGLYFIGEVVDVTGQLGGYNFQWAWASAFAAGQVV